MTTATTTIERTAAHAAPRTAPVPIPFTRLLRVETIKMFNTRAGFWLMVGIAASALIATVSVIAFAPDSAQNYDNFGAAIGIPMALLLPVMAILSVTSEWSQRSGLTTFTLVPHRGRVIWAKLVVSVVLGALSPRTRNAQVALYQSGDVDFLVATDAIGMGLNLDVDHVAFAGTRKFDGQTHRALTPAELGQIAGRAGRRIRYRDRRIPDVVRNPCPRRECRESGRGGEGLEGDASQLRRRNAGACGPDREPDPG